MLCRGECDIPVVSNFLLAVVFLCLPPFSLVSHPFFFPFLSICPFSLIEADELLPIHNKEDMDGVLDISLCLSKPWNQLYTLLFWEPWSSLEFFGLKLLHVLLPYTGCPNHFWIFPNYVVTGSHSVLSLPPQFRPPMIPVFFPFRLIKSSIMVLEQWLHDSSYFVWKVGSCIGKEGNTWILKPLGIRPFNNNFFIAPDLHFM